MTSTGFALPAAAAAAASVLLRRDIFSASWISASISGRGFVDSMMGRTVNLEAEQRRGRDELLHGWEVPFVALSLPGWLAVDRSKEAFRQDTHVNCLLSSRNAPVRFIRAAN